MGTGEMAPWLRALVALTKQVPVSMGWLPTILTPGTGDPMLLISTRGRHMFGTYTLHTCKTSIHITSNKS